MLPSLNNLGSILDSPTYTNNKCKKKEKEKRKNSGERKERREREKRQVKKTTGQTRHWCSHIAPRGAWMESRVGVDRKSVV